MTERVVGWEPEAVQLSLTSAVVCSLSSTISRLQEAVATKPFSWLLLAVPCSAVAFSIRFEYGRVLPTALLATLLGFASIGLLVLVAELLRWAAFWWTARQLTLEEPHSLAASADLQVLSSALLTMAFQRGGGALKAEGALELSRQRRTMLRWREQLQASPRSSQCERLERSVTVRSELGEFIACCATLLQESAPPAPGATLARLEHTRASQRLWAPDEGWESRFSFALENGWRRFLARQDLEARNRIEALRAEELANEERRHALHLQAERQLDAKRLESAQHIESAFLDYERQRETFRTLQNTIGSYGSPPAWRGVMVDVRQALELLHTERERVDAVLTKIARTETIEAVEQLARDCATDLQASFERLMLPCTQLWGEAVALQINLDVEGVEAAREAVCHFLHESAAENDNWSSIWRSIDARGVLWLFATESDGDWNRCHRSFTCRVSFALIPGGGGVRMSMQHFVPFGVCADSAFYAIEERDGHARGNARFLLTSTPRRIDLTSVKHTFTEAQKGISQIRRSMEAKESEWNQDTFSRATQEFDERFQMVRNHESQVEAATKHDTGFFGWSPWRKSDSWSQGERSEAGRNERTVHSSKNASERATRFEHVRTRERQLQKILEAIESHESTTSSEQVLERSVRGVNLDYTDIEALYRQWATAVRAEPQSWISEISDALRSADSLALSLNSFIRAREEKRSQFPGGARLLALTERDLPGTMRFRVSIQGAGAPVHTPSLDSSDLFSASPPSSREVIR